MATTATWVASFLAMMTFPSLLGRDVAAAPTPDCSNVVYDMMSCLEYVTQGSNVTEPTDACCIGVASVVKTDQVCLCQALKEAVAMGVAVNMSRATSLPDACSVKIPPGKHCSGSLPTSAGAASPAPVPSSPSPVQCPQPPAKAPSISPAPQSPPPPPPPPRTFPRTAPSPAPSPTSPTESSGAPTLVSSAVMFAISLSAAVVLSYV